MIKRLFYQYLALRCYSERLHYLDKFLTISSQEQLRKKNVLQQESNAAIIPAGGPMANEFFCKVLNHVHTFVCEAWNADLCEPPISLFLANFMK